MGYTEVNEGYNPPGWMKLYHNLVHCRHCNAVYSKDVKFVKVNDVSTGTQTPSYRYIRNCKENVCPVCEK